MSQENFPVVEERTVVRRERRIPVSGDIHVKVGDTLSPDTIVAGAKVPYHINVVEVPRSLGVHPQDAAKFIIKKVGDATKTDDVIAVRPKSFFRSERVCKAPVDGIVREIRRGRVLIQEFRQLEVEAYIPHSKVVEVLGDEGVIVEAPAAFIQGSFGVGGETYGELKTIAGSSRDVLTENDITPDCEGKILVGGSLVTLRALREAAATRVKGVIVGGIEQKELVNFLGYEIGPITGDEDIGITLILTEGFGKMPMNDDIFQLLQSLSEMEACINGATQIRYGSIRPEIIIPLK